jgi:hypothetical protein
MLILAWVLFGASSALVIKYFAHGKDDWRSFDVIDILIVLVGGLTGPVFLIMFLIVATVIYIGDNSTKEVFYLGERKQKEEDE